MPIADLAAQKQDVISFICFNTAEFCGGALEMNPRPLLCGLLASLMSFAAAAADLATFKFDGKTDDSTRQSNSEIMSHLPNPKKAEYIAALIKIQEHDLKARKASDPNAKSTPIGPKLDGKTYEEILAYAKTIDDVSVSTASTTGGQLVANKPGTLANQKLIADTGNSIAKHLEAEGHHLATGQPSRTFIMSEPAGSPGQRTWTELWEYDVDGQQINYAIDFKETVDGADFAVRRLTKQ